METSILIRVQARGGKFLGPDIGYSNITVRNVATGELLAQSVAAGDSGQIGGSGATPPPVNPSNGVVLTEPLTPTWIWPTPGDPSPTAGFLANFDLEAPALVEIAAAGISNGISDQYVTSVRMWLWPGAQLTTEPGLVLEMPGLAVRILAPGPLQPAPFKAPIPVEAWVTMMCGCEIGKPAWPASQFEVNAWLVKPDGTATPPTPLWLKRSTPSVFAGVLGAVSTPGSYQLVVSALQPSASNAGGAAMVFTVGA